MALLSPAIQGRDALICSRIGLVEFFAIAKERIALARPDDTQDILEVRLKLDVIRARLAASALSARKVRMSVKHRKKIHVAPLILVVLNCFTRFLPAFRQRRHTRNSIRHVTSF